MTTIQSEIPDFLPTHWAEAEARGQKAVDHIIAIALSSQI